MRISRSSGEGARADERRQLAGGAAPREIHLEEAVLRVQKAGGARDVGTRGAADGRNSEGVARHLHRRREPGQMPRALELREAAAQLRASPQGAEARGDQQQDKSHEENAKQAALHLSCGSRRPSGLRASGLSILAPR